MGKCDVPIARKLCGWQEDSSLSQVNQKPPFIFAAKTVVICLMPPIFAIGPFLDHSPKTMLAHTLRPVDN